MICSCTLREGRASLGVEASLSYIVNSQQEVFMKFAWCSMPVILPTQKAEAGEWSFSSKS